MTPAAILNDLPGMLLNIVASNEVVRWDDFMIELNSISLGASLENAFREKYGSPAEQ